MRSIRTYGAPVLLILPVVFVITLAAVNSGCAQKVLAGADVLLSKRLSLLEGKRVGVLCNHTSVLSNGTHLADALLRRGIRVTKLYAPEHGIRGTAGEGVEIGGDSDRATRLPVVSLYGKTRKPTAEMLQGIDILVCDLQDVGARYYTYVSTMALAMESAAESKIPFVVLDRPNPINGTDIEGPVLDTAVASFIGMFPVPVRHGCTLGELARIIAGEGWLSGGVKPELTVIPMEGWKRSMWFDETGLPWVSPSPNMKSLATATVYPGTCLIEGTNVSEGRGTSTPFEIIGAPWIDGTLLERKLSYAGLAGVTFHAAQFVPEGSNPEPKYRGRSCGGVSIKVTDRKKFLPVETGLALLDVLNGQYHDSLKISASSMGRLSGVKGAAAILAEGGSVRVMVQKSAGQLDLFREKRLKYLLY